MAVPPWTREFFPGSLDDVAQRIKSAIASTQIPAVALRGIDRVMREANRGAQQLRRWAQRFSSLSFATMNASGVYLHEELAAVPLAAAQLHAMFPGELLAPRRETADRQRIEQLCGAAVSATLNVATLVARSTDAAIVAAVASLPSDALIVLRRCDAIRLDSPRTLPDLCAALGHRVLEIGSTAEVAAEDWSSVKQAQRGPLALVQVSWPQGSTIGQLPLAPPANLAIDFSILIAPLGSLRHIEPLPPQQTDPLTSQKLEPHTLTILPGHRLVGGPRSGMILGKNEAIERVRGTSLWSLLQADVGTIAGLTYTLQQAGPAPFGLESLLNTSVENLDDRAQRLSVQLAADPTIVAVEIIPTSASVAAELPRTIPSRALRLRHATWTPEQWAKVLADETPSLIVNSSEDAIVVDLRWVPPQLDQRLATILSRPGNASEAAPQTSR